MAKWLIAVCIAVVGGALAIPQADAAKVGGNRSSGVQRNVTTPPPANTPGKPAQQAGQTSNAAPAGQAAPAPSGLARWAPMLGGLALGGLLGSMFGSGALGGIMSVLMIALVVFGVVMLIRYFLRGRTQQAPEPMQFAGGGGRDNVSVPPSAQAPAAQASGLSSGLSPAAPVAMQAAVNVPAGFDSAGFVRGAKMNYVRLQVANDAGNLDEIRELTTPELFEDLKKDVIDRAGASQQTDVVTLEADLLEVATEGDKHWASVRFTGMVRETPGTAPVGFQEVWNLVKPADGSSGWLLAGIQQME
jgi:predicted lipid-binding transport protein (Tim44 family)